MRPAQLHKLYLCKSKYGSDLLGDDLRDPEFLERAVQLNGDLFMLAPVQMLTKHLALLAVRATPTVLARLPATYKFDRDVVRAACLGNPMCISFIHSYFILDDIPLFRELVAINGMCIQHATTKVKHCRDVALAAVTKSGAAFEYLPMLWCDDWALASVAFKKEPRMFKFTSCRIKDTEDYALEAVRYCAENFLDVSFRLKNDFAFVSAAVKLDPKVLLHVANQEISHHNLIMYEVVYRNPWILMQLPHCRVVLEDSTVLLRVVEQDGTALQYAPEWLRDDDIIGLAAVRQHASAYMYLSSRLKGRRDIVLATIHNASQYIADIPREYYVDMDVVFAAVQSYGVTVSHFPKHMVTYEVALAAVRSAGFALAHMPQWNDDEHVVTAAVEQHYTALEYVSERLQLRKDIVLSAVRKNWRSIKYMNQKFRSDRDVALAAVQQHGQALDWMHFCDDAEICLLALVTCPNVFDDFHESLLADEAFLMRAVRLQPTLMGRFPQTAVFRTAALAHCKDHPRFSFYNALTSAEYEEVHDHVVAARAARCGGCYFLTLKTPLDQHGIYARRLKRAILQYAGFPFGNTWSDVRRAYANLL